MTHQHKIFLKEGNNWFKRNKNKIARRNNEILNYIKDSKIKSKRVLDVGCCYGYLLHQIKLINKRVECHGIEPSIKAINYGQKKYPGLNFKQEFSHDLSSYEDNYFDLITVSFVFHWIDRTKLLLTVSEIDRVLKDFGYLIIQDFSPKYIYKTKYHHLPDEEVFTYKQPYWDIFTASKLYTTVYVKEFYHNKSDKIDNKNLCKIVVLQKRQQVNYPLL